MVFSIVGADCIDVAADPAVVTAAKDGLEAAQTWMASSLHSMSHAASQHLTGKPLQFPWLMVSLNDGEDPHFRKATFDPQMCPSDCPRPCEAICPADAIAFSQPLGEALPVAATEKNGVIESRCYGCGRCLPVCPIQHITTRSVLSNAATIAPQLFPLVDAVEIHTQVGRESEFESLWQAIAPHLHHLKAIAISCPDGDGLIDYLWSLHTRMSPLPCPVIWQTDGRPMSGDIGKGTTHATIRLGQKVLADGPPGYVQLAGGTNQHTVPKLRQLGLLAPHPVPKATDLTHCKTQNLRYIHGIAYGSYARTLLAPTLNALAASDLPIPLETHPSLLQSALEHASQLIRPLKSPDYTTIVDRPLVPHV